MYSIHPKLLSNHKLRGLLFLFSFIFQLLFIILFFNLHFSQRAMVNTVIDPYDPIMGLDIFTYDSYISTYGNYSGLLEDINNIETISSNYSFLFSSSVLVLPNNVTLTKYQECVAFNHEFFTYISKGAGDNVVLVEALTAKYYDIHVGEQVSLKLNTSSGIIEISATVGGIIRKETVEYLTPRYTIYPDFFFNIESLPPEIINEKIDQFYMELLCLNLTKDRSLDQLASLNAELEGLLKDIVEKNGFNDYIIRTYLKDKIELIRQRLSHYSSFLYLSFTPLTLVFIFIMRIVGNAILESNKNRLRILIERGIAFEQVMTHLMLNMIFVLFCSSSFSILIAYLLYEYLDLFFDFFVASSVAIVIFSLLFCLAYWYETITIVKREFEQHEVILKREVNTHFNIVLHLGIFLLLGCFALLFAPGLSPFTFATTHIISLIFQIALIIYVLYLLIFQALKISLYAVGRTIGSIHRLGNAGFKVFFKHRKLTRMLARALILSTTVVFVLSSTAENTIISNNYLADASFAGDILWQQTEGDINFNMTFQTVTQLLSSIPAVKQFLPMVDADIRGGKLELLMDGYSVKYAIVDINATLTLLHHPLKTEKYSSSTLIEKLNTSSNGILVSKKLWKRIKSESEHYALLGGEYVKVEIIDKFYSLPLLNWTVDTRAILVDFNIFNDHSSFLLSKFYLQVTNNVEPKQVINSIIHRAKELNITLTSKEFTTYEEYKAARIIVSRKMDNYVLIGMVITMVALMVLILYVIGVLLDNSMPDMTIMLSRGAHYRTLFLLSSLSYCTFVLITTLLGFLSSLPFILVILLNNEAYKLYHFVYLPLKSIELFVGLILLNSLAIILYLYLTLKAKFRE